MDALNIRSLLTSFEVYEDIRSLGDVIKGINISALTSKHFYEKAALRAESVTDLTDVTSA